MSAPAAHLLLFVAPMGSSLFTSALASALAGFVGSLHCAGMCGPLACAATRRASPGSERFAASVAWQGARIVAYAVAGGLLGAFGERAGGLLSIATSPWLPWALALLLVASAFQWTAHLGRLPGFPGAGRRLVTLGTGRSPTTGAALWGLVTPLLPCGFLYGALATSLVAGSALAGATVTAAFGLGTMPALAAAQAPLGLERRLPEGWGRLLRQAVPLTTAAVLVWRALHAAPESCCPR